MPSTVEGELAPHPSTEHVPIFFPLLTTHDASFSSALVGTLRSAKRQKIVKYDSEMLLQGMSDDIDIVLLV
jgi:hypothetical protein